MTMGEKATELATLGGGCFWCTEAVFEQVRGVHRVVSGYCGGHLANPDYHSVCEGGSGHAEVVQVAFDPAVIDFRGILEIFFATHDPTTPGRQGNDVGTQYRSVIFYGSDAQRETAASLIDELDASEGWPAPIVTELAPAATFYPAEDYHQHYFARNPAQSYCQFVVAPKLDKFRRKFAALLRPSR